MSKVCEFTSCSSKQDHPEQRLTLLRCSRCKNAYYCSKECQKKHWRAHKKDCTPRSQEKQAQPPLVMEKVIFGETLVPKHIVPEKMTVDSKEQVKGRGVYALCSLQKGETAFNEFPYVYCSQHYQHMEDDRECHYCGRPSPFVEPNTRTPFRPFLCRNRCCTMIYCSTECESKSYTQYHKILCARESTSPLGVDGRQSVIRLREYSKQSGYKYPIMVMLIIAKYLCGSESSGKHNAASQPWKHIWVPTLDMDDIQDKWEMELSLLKDIFYTVPKARIFLDMEVYLSFCAMFRANNIFVKTHGVTPSVDESQRVVTGNWTEGPALFQFASLMNHSCYPTIEIVRKANACTEFRALEDMEEGEELTIDYLSLYEEYGPIAWGVNVNHLPEPIQLEIIDRFIHRQTQMKENYSCFCACRLCKRDLPLSHSIC